MKAPKFWYSSHPINLLFSPASYFVSLVMILRRVLGKKKVLHIPSVGVGSLALGGAGKTTLSLKIAGTFSENGIRPAIVHSGYGGKKEGVFFPDSEIIDDVSDEVILALKRNFISASFKKREISIQSLKGVADVIIFDDFFSHLIEPEIKFLVFTRESIGNTLLFPFGPLREPIISALWADYILIEKDIKDSFKRKIKKLNREIFIFSSSVKKFLFSNGKEVSEKDTSELSGSKAILISAIAIPQRFSRMMSEAGIKIMEHLIFPDHAKISYNIIHEIKEKLHNSRIADIVITTEKDLWKIHNYKFLQFPLYGARVDFDIEDKEETFKKILTKSISTSKF